MTLRSRTALSVGIVLLACIALTFGMSYFLVSAGMQRTTERALREIGTAREAATQVATASALEALKVDTASLAARAASWARRDDMYAYVESRNAAWRRASLPDSVCQEYGLSALLIVSSSGRLVDRLSYDLDRRSFGDTPASLTAAISAGGALAPATLPAAGLAGIMLLPEGPMLVAASPILPADAALPPRGALILGRFLTASQLDALGQRTGAAIELFRADAADLPADIRSAPQAGTAPAVRAAPGEKPAGYAALAGISGSPALLARITMRSDITEAAIAALTTVSRQAAAASLWLALLLGGSALIVLGTTLLVVERSLLRRAAALTTRLEEIAASPAPGSRVEVHGDDELARLEGSVNEALAAIEEAGRQAGERERALAAALERTRLALQATGQLFFDVRSGRISFEGAVSRVTGYPPEELHSIPLAAWEAMVHPDDRPAVVSAAEQAASAGTPYRVDYRLRRKDSSFVMVEERGIRAPGDGERMVGTIRLAPPAPHAPPPPPVQPPPQATPPEAPPAFGPGQATQR